MKSISAAIIVLSGVICYAVATAAQNPFHSEKLFLETLGGWLLFLGIAGWLIGTCVAPVIEWIKSRWSRH